MANNGCYQELIMFEGYGFHKNFKYDTDKKAMDRILNQISAMLSYHSRIMIVRVDLHPECYTKDNAPISTFIKAAKTWLMKEYSFTHIGYAWCREQVQSKKQHYHFIWIVDRHKVQFPKKMLEGLKQIWEKMKNGSFQYTPSNCYYHIQRGDYGEETGKMITRISYLAKMNTKKKSKGKNYGTSRVKHNHAQKDIKQAKHKIHTKKSNQETSKKTINKQIATN